MVPTTLSRARLEFGTGYSFREALAALTHGEANVVPTTLSRARLEFRTGIRFPTMAWIARHHKTRILSILIALTGIWDPLHSAASHCRALGVSQHASSTNIP